MDSNKNNIIKRFDLVDNNGKFTNIGMFALIFITCECLKIALNKFNELIEEDKNNE